MTPTPTCPRWSTRTTATTNSAKAVLQRSEYEPYGYLLNRTMEDGPGYTGHVTDAATGLVYMQQRYYDPSTDPQNSKACQMAGAFSSVNRMLLRYAASRRASGAMRCRRPPWCSR
jgi:RHS repeat-associated protein